LVAVDPVNDAVEPASIIEFAGHEISLLVAFNKIEFAPCRVAPVTPEEFK
jgi:hypothetical protein